MWIVYQIGTSFLHTGFEVPTEDEAKEYCDEDQKYTYMYLNWKSEHFRRCNNEIMAQRFN